MESEGPGRGRTEDQTTAAEETVPPDYAEYSAENVLLRREEDMLSIEEARLQRVGREDVPEVVVRVNASADYEDCFLVRRSTWLDLEPSFRSDNVPDRLVFEHPWGRRTLKEEFITGDGMVVIFRESASSDAEETEVSAVPLYALCYTQAVAGGAGERPTTWYDASPVEGIIRRSG